jgi:hypothetical protein
LCYALSGECVCGSSAAGKMTPASPHRIIVALEMTMAMPVMLPISVKKLEFVGVQRIALLSTIIAAGGFCVTLSIPPYEEQLANDDPLLLICLINIRQSHQNSCSRSCQFKMCNTASPHKSRRVAGTEVAHPRDLLGLILTVFPMIIG